ncbi:MAG: hypothetical protein HYS21_11080 [Deltaproteobacteria bacterium]|nr:hypothetical protein [Deltaproteobacteria bacterium]
MLSRKEYILAIILVPLWIIGGASIFKGELAAVKIIPALFGMSSDERAGLSGPLYNLTQRLNSVVPATDKTTKIYFFVPPEQGKEEYYSGKISYYLCPRNVTMIKPGGEFDFNTIKKGDYLLVFTPASLMNSGFESDLLSIISSSALYEFADEKGRQAIYRVERDG